jgi:hypothetical protein
MLIGGALDAPQIRAATTSFALLGREVVAGVDDLAATVNSCVRVVGAPESTRSWRLIEVLIDPLYEG